MDKATRSYCGGVHLPHNECPSEHSIATMSKKQKRFALIGMIAAMAIAGGLLILLQPKAEAGRVEFVSFYDFHGQKQAGFVYHAPQGLQGYWLIKCKRLEALTGKALPGSQTITYHPTTEAGFVEDCPTNAVWRTQVELIMPAKAIPAFFARLENVCREKRLTAWHYTPLRVVGPVYSCPVTNPVPSTAKHGE